MGKFEKEITNIYNKLGYTYHQRVTEDKKIYYRFLEMPATLSLLKNIKNKKILDLGCGSGLYSKILKDRGACVYGIDLSPKMIEVAKSYVPNVEFKIGTVYKLPYKSNYFDIVISTYVIHYFENLDKALQEVKRVLKKNGVYIFSTKNPVTEATSGIEGKYSKSRVFGNYFKEGRYATEWHTGKKVIAKVPYIHHTYETLIKTIIRNGFSIEDYIDGKPTIEGKKIDSVAYEYASKVPLICVFKIRKI